MHVFLLAAALAGSDDGIPVRPDLSDPDVKRAVQLDVLEDLVEEQLYEDALRTAADLRAQGVRDERLDVAQARAMAANGLRTEAIALLQGVVKRHPQNAHGWAALGIVSADNKDLVGAVRAFERATRLEPGNAGHHNNLGWVQLATGRPEPAIESFKRSLALDPSQERTRNNLGFALARAERDTEALEVFRSVGSESDARYNLGVACEQRLDTTSALAQYQAALRAQADHPKARAALMRLLPQDSP
jgi:Tfp pilus assembly protein PilF